MGDGPAHIEHYREAIRELTQLHRATAISVFGSAARGDDGATSDIDLLVAFHPDVCLLDLAARRKTSNSYQAEGSTCFAQGAQAPRRSPANRRHPGLK